MSMPVVIGSDHAGFPLKKFLIETMPSIQWEDEGCYSLDSVDYPAIAKKVAMKVAAIKGRGILICGSGIGVSIAANKIPSIRAALVWDVTSARLSREHNDANILCLGGRLIGSEVAKEICSVWLATSFLKGRHEGRLQLITEMEGACTK